MKKFRVFSHPDKGYEVVKVGFSWFALIFGILWILANRLWLKAGLWFLAMIVLGIIDKVANNLPQNAATTIIYLFLSAAYFAVWLIPAFKGNNWKEQSLRKMGYVQIHTNEGVSINEIADAPESLIGATWHGNSSTVSKLIRDGADVNATNASGYTALDVASARGDTSTVLLLLSHGARIRGGSVELNAE